MKDKSERKKSRQRASEKQSYVLKVKARKDSTTSPGRLQRCLVKDTGIQTGFMAQMEVLHLEILWSPLSNGVQCSGGIWRKGS